MSASKADQPMVSKKASQGTPGLKYLRPSQSRKANGVVMTSRSDLNVSSTVSRNNPHNQPISIQTKRPIPTQNSQMLRMFSHQRIAMAMRKSRRLERKGTV
jgi:hypothetical protein